MSTHTESSAVQSAAMMALLVLSTLAACAPGAAAEAMRPEAPTATAALGETSTWACDSTPEYRTPLVIDLSASARTDLELAMGRGIAVVQYACDGLRLLLDCHVDGDYGYAGVTLKEEAVELTGRDELQVNLPITALSVGAGIARGTRTALALAIVGKRRTVVRAVARQQLQGSCKGATHFVRAATVGAFAMLRSSDASVNIATSLLGAKSTAKSTSDRTDVQRDGSLPSCRQARRDAAGPPEQCDSALRLDLRPLSMVPDEHANAESTDSEEGQAPGALADPCPESYVLSAGKCTRRDAAKGYTCDADNEAECRTQCDLGSADSCYHLGLIMHRGVSADVEKTKARATVGVQLFRQACDGGNVAACHHVGMSYDYEQNEAMRDVVEATDYLQRACNGGSAHSCLYLAQHYDDGKKGWYKSPVAAFRYYRRGCELGLRFACFHLISKHFRGQGTAKDPAAAFRVLKRTCDAGNAKRCAELGIYKLDKRFGPTDVPLALQYLDKSCQMGRDDGCRYLAKVLTDGELTPVDIERARPAAKKGCVGKAAESDFCTNLLQLVK